MIVILSLFIVCFYTGMDWIVFIGSNESGDSIMLHCLCFSMGALPNTNHFTRVLGTFQFFFRRAVTSEMVLQHAKRKGLKQWFPKRFGTRCSIGTLVTILSDPITHPFTTTSRRLSESNSKQLFFTNGT